MVEGDYKRLVQVVSNLLTNAAKYTPEGGNIVVRLQVHPAEVLVEVSDNGIGMAPEMLSHVFDLFAQAKRTSDRSQGGLGLGLALVKNLVESHGGSVLAGSEGIGRGSTFTVRLPRLSSKPVSTPHAGTVSGKRIDYPGSPLRVLIVDDNADAANVLQMLLSTTGHEVRIEYTAASAIERARQFAPQVCLLDIGLPDMDGKDLARRLRSMPETADAMLIAATGYGQEQDRKDTIAAGFDHHFVKPVDTAKLLALLKAFRPRRAAQ
jgi:CheY-like chemotaxis protein